MKAALLTPAPGHPGDWALAYRAIAASLEQAGIEPVARPWTEVGDLSGFDVALPLLAHGFREDLVRWNALLDILQQACAKAANPMPLLRWGSDKAYLGKLEATGVPIIPTHFVRIADESALSRARHAWGGTLVIKPVGAAIPDLVRIVGPTDPLPDLPRARMMIQPYFETIASEGKYSFIFFSGQFSHALVTKSDACGHPASIAPGGEAVAYTPSEDALKLASAALMRTPMTPVYARVDLARDALGALRVMGINLIEPALRLDLSPHPDRFGQAVRSFAAPKAQVACCGPGTA